MMYICILLLHFIVFVITLFTLCTGNWQESKAKMGRVRILKDTNVRKRKRSLKRKSRVTDVSQTEIKQRGDTATVQKTLLEKL